MIKKTISVLSLMPFVLNYAAELHTGRLSRPELAQPAAAQGSDVLGISSAATGAQPGMQRYPRLSLSGSAQEHTFECCGISFPSYRKRAAHMFFGQCTLLSESSKALLAGTRKVSQDTYTDDSEFEPDQEDEDSEEYKISESDDVESDQEDKITVWPTRKRKSGPKKSVKAAPKKARASGVASSVEAQGVSPCQFCGKSYTRSNLSRHLRIHTGEKRFKYGNCGQRFTEKHHLASHERTHTGERPFQCAECDYRASDRSNMHRHLRIWHKLKRQQVEKESESELS